MTRDDIIRMAREACDADKVDAWHNGFWTLTQEELERFTALVAAAVEQKYIRAASELIPVAVAAEREACAKVCDGLIPPAGPVFDLSPDLIAAGCAATIRARGEMK
jgi:hypothetical protein